MNGELKTLKDKLLYEERKRRCLEDEIIILKNALNDDNAEYEVVVLFIQKVIY